MEVRKKFEAGEVYIPPDASEVVYEYDGQVFELNVTLAFIYGNVLQDGIVDVDEISIEIDSGITKLDIIDFARHD